MQKFVTTGAHPNNHRRSTNKTAARRDSNHNDLAHSPPPPPQNHVLSITVEEGSLSHAVQRRRPASPAVASPPPPPQPPPPPPHHSARFHAPPSMDSQSLRMDLGGVSEDELESSDHYMTANRIGPAVHQTSSKLKKLTDADHTLDFRLSESIDEWRENWRQKGPEGRGPGFIPYRDSLSSGPAWTTETSHHSYRHSDRLIRTKDFAPSKQGWESSNWFKKSASARFPGRELTVPAAATLPASPAVWPVPTSAPTRRTRRKDRRRRARQVFDYSMHRWLLLGVLGAFLVWAAIFFPILLAANTSHDLPPPHHYPT